MPARLIRLFLNDPGLLLKYVSAGAIAATVEFVLFTGFHQGLGWPLLAANCSALAVAVATGFALQKNWTFRARGGMSRQFRLYVLMQGISAVLNNLLIFLFVAQWAWAPPVAKVAEIGIVFVWNFSFCRLVIFADSALRRA